MADESLRKKLDDMAEKYPRHQHTAVIEKLWLTHRHAIAVEPNSDQLTDFNCVALSFGLQDDIDFRSIVHSQPGVFAGRDFVEFVLAQNVLVEVSEASAQQGDLVLYFKGNIFTHTARVILNGQVVSKWGRGQIYRHGLWEVPLAYGEAVRYYKAPSVEQASALFQAYAKTKGVEFLETY